MDEARLAEIEARASAATPGPWRNRGAYALSRVNDGNVEGWPYGKTLPLGRCCGCRSAGEPCANTVMYRGEYDAAPRAYHSTWCERPDGWQDIGSASTFTAVTGNYDYEEGGVCSTREDSDFIAHARVDVPALVAEVRRLRAEAERQLDEARVDADRLREELAAMEHLCAAHELSLHSQCGALSRAERERDEARERLVAAEECYDFTALTRNAAVAEAERLRAALATARREGAEAMRAAGLEACREALRDPADIAVIGRVVDAIRALPVDAKGGA